MNKTTANVLLTGIGLIESVLTTADKQADYSFIREKYLDDILNTMEGFLGSDGAVTRYQNEMRRSVAEAFPEAFHAGYEDAGGEEIEPEDDEWLTARMDSELANVGLLFQGLRDARKEGETEDLAAGHADAYARSLDSTYNQGKLRGAKNKMLTFEGDDGEVSCNTCQRHKGQRHSAKWWINKGLVPGQPGNDSFECGGYRCQHYLEDDEGEQYTE